MITHDLIRQPVENKPYASSCIMLNYENDGAVEVGVHKDRGGDHQMTGKGAHSDLIVAERPGLGHGYSRRMSFPSVLLHDHLDGGLRASTVLDLAQTQGYPHLPSADVNELAAWFDQSSSRSLEQYLEPFKHTVALMQDQASLERVAYEAALDLAADGVVYAEIRFRPNHHVQAGLSGHQVVDAVASGLKLGGGETGLRWALIVDALRQFDDSLDQARLAVGSMSGAVVGFDLAGPEAGHPPERHLPALRLARESGLRITIHAGEAAGNLATRYIASSMDRCGAERLGHGVEIVSDCTVVDNDIVHMGSVAQRVLDRQIPLELCPQSNMATGGLAANTHPLGMLYRAGFNVTISTDNRLMSNTSMSKEFEFAVKHHYFSPTDLALTTRRSLAAAFTSHETKVELWEDTIAPAYRAGGAEVSDRWEVT